MESRSLVCRSTGVDERRAIQRKMGIRHSAFEIWNDGWQQASAPQRRQRWVYVGRDVGRGFGMEALKA